MGKAPVKGQGWGQIHIWYNINLLSGVCDCNYVYWLMYINIYFCIFMESLPYATRSISQETNHDILGKVHS